MTKTSILLGLLFFILFDLSAQIGTSRVFDFIHLPSNPRVSAMAGSLITVQDDDVGLGSQNPALINSKHKHQISINHAFHLADINYGNSSYGYHFDSLGISMQIAAQYLSYGEFVRANIFGEQTGNFEASESAFSVGISKTLKQRITIGMNVRFISSKYDQFTSSGIATDLGILYNIPEKQVAFGAVVKNLGIQLNAFNELKEEPRLDVQIAYSKKLKYLPFRYVFTAHNLQQWNIRYKDPADIETDLSGEVIEESNFTAQVDNFFRHIKFGGEFLLGKNDVFRLRFGYDHLRRRELSVLSLSSLAGFSFGAGISIKKIKIDYAVSRFHLGGGTNHIGIRMNLANFFGQRFS